MNTKPTFPTDPDGSPIHAIEYHHHGKDGWQPHAIVSAGSTYDADWCRTYGRPIIHDSGSGGDPEGYGLASYVDAPKLCAKLWLAPGCQPLGEGGKVLTPAEARALGYQLIPSPLDPDPFAGFSGDEQAEYCGVCHDYLPSENTCRHLHYEEGCGYTLGCGASELDIGETQRSLFRLLRMLPKDAIARLGKILTGRLHSQFSDSLLGGHCQLHFRARRQSLTLYCEPLGEQHRYEERFWPGVAWLHSLDPKCPEAIALTAGWLWQFQHEDWRAHCVKPETWLPIRLPAAELESWLALDPLDPGKLHDRPLVVKKFRKPSCANEHRFNADPRQLEEVTLWPAEGDIGDQEVTFSVAEVKRGERDGEVRLILGSAITHRGQHISKLPDFRMVTHY